MNTIADNSHNIMDAHKNMDAILEQNRAQHEATLAQDSGRDDATAAREADKLRIQGDVARGILRRSCNQCRSSRKRWHGCLQSSFCVPVVRADAEQGQLGGRRD